MREISSTARHLWPNVKGIGERAGKSWPAADGLAWLAIHLFGGKAAERINEKATNETRIVACDVSRGIRRQPMYGWRHTRGARMSKAGNRRPPDARYKQEAVLRKNHRRLSALASALAGPKWK